VRQVQIPKAGKPGEFRTLGIPTIYDRVSQQALLNRLEPIFEPIFDDASFGYRRGRSTKDAMRKVWREIQSGQEWIVDGDLKDFFGSVDHEKLLTLVAQRVADGRVLRLIRAMLKAGSYGKGRRLSTERGTPQGGVVACGGKMRQGRLGTLSAKGEESVKRSRWTEMEQVQSGFQAHGGRPHGGR
jgi:retron-type reverse transcriptase